MGAAAEEKVSILELTVLRRLARATMDIHRWNSTPATNQDWNDLTEYRQAQAEALQEWMSLTEEHKPDVPATNLDLVKLELQRKSLDLICEELHGIVSRARDDLHRAIDDKAPQLAGTTDEYRQRHYERQRRYSLQNAMQSLGAALARFREMEVHLDDALKSLLSLRM